MTNTSRARRNLPESANKRYGGVQKYKKLWLGAKQQAAYLAKKVTILEREKEKGFFHRLLDKFLKY